MIFWVAKAFGINSTPKAIHIVLGFASYYKCISIALVVLLILNAFATRAITY